jgi:subtilisin family serine protease
VQGIKDLGLNIHLVSKWLNGAVVYSSDSALAGQALALGYVEGSLDKTSVISQLEYSQHAGTPSKPATDSTLGDTYNYGYSQGQIYIHNLQHLHNNGYNGQGMRIGLMDAGYTNMDVHPGFDSLFARGGVVAQWDFVDRDSILFDGRGDDGHGMNVASIIAGFYPGKMIGSAPGADLVLARTEDAWSETRVEEYNWVASAEYLDSLGVDIINSSLGYSTFDISTQNYSYTDMNGRSSPASLAAEMASAKGILVVVSAGNEGSSGWGYITAPSDAQNILCVGATSTDSNRASFSSYGPSSDGRTKPDVMSVGRQTTLMFSYAGLGAGDGTSFSAPNMAGAAACLWQAHPGLTNLQVIQAILWNSDIYWQPNNQYGYGIPNLYLAALNPMQANGTRENPALLELKAYPNPANESLIIKLPSGNTGHEQWQIHITGMDGSHKYTGQIAHHGGWHKLNISQLSAGMYFVRVNNTRTIMSGRIVKTD